MKTIMNVKAAAVGMIAAMICGSGGYAADKSVTFALPAQSLLFSPFYVADDKGFFKEEGLDVKTTVVAGPGTVTAVLSGSADIGSIAGAVIVAAAAKNQRVDIIGLTQSSFSTEIVLSKEAAAKTGISPTASDADRAKALKGLTIGVDAVGGLPHGYLRFIAKKVGLNADKDMTVTPLQPPAMISALQQGRIDGFVFSQPFTLQATNEGAVKWFSGIRGDLPELNPNLYNVVIAHSGYCKENAETCTKFMRAVGKAMTLIKDKPDDALASLQKVFAKMPPEILKESFKATAGLTLPQATVSEQAVTNTIDYAKAAGMIPEGTQLPEAKSFFDNSYIK
ncbi:ABC transporter substrate-binding protein [Mesorhizobium sp. J428]|uniref:ABC transporter substrate-binding protein n=1 Tax=Mesorhizobium sp. J428 TaxID=2898440 RepID=UPI002150D352|nr:ABC transporter substrate-binding protein [Mesorhizobium sp. J428]MCR5857975.1 ABC transporter substrate-binding protein [Mesorhizobium sp. J428]